MDVSKLPRLSKTDSPALQSGTPEPEAPSPVVDSHEHTIVEPLSGRGPEAWISIAIGAFLIYMYPRFLQWLSSQLFHTHFDEFELDGKIVPYTQVPEFWMDLGPVLFGVVLILDGIVLLTTRTRWLHGVAFVLTILTTIYNFLYVVLSYNKYGAAPISFLAAAFGAYIAWYQWKTLQMRGAPPKTMPPARG